VAKQSKNYRYSTAHQVVIDADTRRVVVVGRPVPGNRHDSRGWEESGAKAVVGNTMTIADGGYQVTGHVAVPRSPPWSADVHGPRSGRAVAARLVERQQTLDVTGLQLVREQGPHLLSVSARHRAVRPTCLSPRSAAASRSGVGCVSTREGRASASRRHAAGRPAGDRGRSRFFPGRPDGQATGAKAVIASTRSAGASSGIR